MIFFLSFLFCFLSFTSQECVELGFPSDKKAKSFTSTNEKLACGLTEINEYDFERVTIQKSGLSSISGISSLSNLKLLDLKKNNIDDISSLSGLMELVTVDLSHNDITRIVGLDSTVLEVLDMGFNKIESTEGLESVCPSLLKLILRKNLILEVSGLERCSALKDLDLSINEIESISGLSIDAPNSLKKIVLNKNKISEFSALGQFPELKEILLRENKIRTFASLASFNESSLAKLKKVDLTDNPIEKSCENYCVYKDSYMGNDWTDKVIIDSDIRRWIQDDHDEECKCHAPPPPPPYLLWLLLGLAGVVVILLGAIMCIVCIKRCCRSKKMKKEEKKEDSEDVEKPQREQRPRSVDDGKGQTEDTSYEKLVEQQKKRKEIENALLDNLEKNPDCVNLEPLKSLIPSKHGGGEHSKGEKEAENPQQSGGEEHSEKEKEGEEEEITYEISNPLEEQNIENNIPDLGIDELIQRHEFEEEKASDSTSDENKLVEKNKIIE